MTTQSNSDRGPRIAIVGGGSAGTAAAWKLRTLLGNAASIVVFEREDRVGGRAHDVEVGGTTVEVGGSILHSSGRHVRSLMELTGAHEGDSGLSLDGKDETYAFWTDEGFAVQTHTSMASMAWGILRHVGLRSALAVTTSARRMAGRFETVYEHQDRGELFETPDELLSVLGLAGETNVSMRQALADRGVNDRMITDIVEAIIHNMYNQGAEINALAGEVGLAGAGLSGGYLFSIEGGNWSLFDRALSAVHAEVRPATAVIHVEGVTSPQARYHVTTVPVSDPSGTADQDAVSVDQFEGGSTRTEEFDAVIIAAPLALSDLDLVVDGSSLDVARAPYQQVHTTLVVGEPDPKYFGADPRSHLPSTIFAASSAPTPFKSFGVTGFSSKYQQRIYKIFSADLEMDDEILGQIFSHIDEVRRFTWRGAYPVLTPGIHHVPFHLAPGLGYACAFETAAGSIEVEAVGGVNTAGLIARDLRG